MGNSQVSPPSSLPHPCQTVDSQSPQRKDEPGGLLGLRTSLMQIPDLSSLDPYFHTKNNVFKPRILCPEEFPCTEI